MDAHTVFVCDECILAAANDEWPDREEEYHTQLDWYQRGMTPYEPTLQPAPLALLKPGEQLTVPIVEEGHFSGHPCDTCGTDLASDRYPATVIRTTTEEYVDAVG